MVCPDKNSIREIKKNCKYFLFIDDIQIHLTRSHIVLTGKNNTVNQQYLIHAKKCTIDEKACCVYVSALPGGDGIMLHSVHIVIV